ncbi:MAG: hypothetical protein HY775_02330 [Acidobacteria bacterium]|nr:hypothetical protein [Acidobacteriota bacterium]
MRQLIRCSTATLVLALTLGWTIATVRPAHAYVDPGTGSYMIQVVAGLIGGLLLTVGAFWRRIFAFLRGGRRKSEERAPEGAPPSA